MPHQVLLEQANRQIANDERMVSGWSDLVARMQAEGRDVTLACQLLDVFKSNLEAHRSSRDLIERMIAGQSVQNPPLPPNLANWA